MADYKAPPSMRDGLSYDDWKKELNIWKTFTSLNPEKQGPAVFLTLTGKAREAVLNDVEPTDLSAGDGLMKLTNSLDTIYLKDESQTQFAAFDDFITYRRKSSEGLKNFLIEFDLRYKKIKNQKMELPEGVQAYCLLKCANLDSGQEQLCKATCQELTYENMKKQVQKLISNKECVDTSEISPIHFTEDQEDHQAFYGSSNKNYRRFNQPDENASRNPKRMNPPDEYGNPTPCRYCHSIYHWIDKCPDAPDSARRPRNHRSLRGRATRPFSRTSRGGNQWNSNRGSNEDIYFTECSETDCVFLAEEQEMDLLKEAIGHCVVDSGCSRTVCGELWLSSYLDSLSTRDRENVLSRPSYYNFKFGVGKVYRSSQEVTIPIYIQGRKLKISTQVVEANIPLLLSRSTMKKASAELNFETDIIKIFGKEVPLKISQSGHYCLPIGRPVSVDNPETVLFTSPLANVRRKDVHQSIEKLHKKFIHPPAYKLKKLINDSGIKDKDILNAVDFVSEKCTTCKMFRTTPPRPVVSFPIASTFNEVVALDLKFLDSSIILHMIDHATRYSRACIIPNKKKRTIVRGILDHWISIFGSPQKFLSDNGGEFVNDEFTELAEQFNITVLTTAAESPWSNGLCERHNGILADLVQKTQIDTNCSLEMCLSWAVAVKNTSTNVYGFSPNQLVFGRNPSLPNVTDDKPPAGNDPTELMRQTLTCLQAARQEFTSQQACEKLRRALSKKTRNQLHYSNGDSVFYKRDNSRMWHGPAKVLGRDSQNYLLKQGGTYVRVHPCRMQLETPLSEIKDLPSEPDNQDLCEPTKKLEPVEQERNESSSSENEENDKIPHTVNNQGTQGTTAQPIRNSRLPLAIRRLADHNVPPTTNTDDVFITNCSKLVDAKHEELKKWKDLEVFKEVEDEGQYPRVTTKWVCTEKEKGGKTVTKARLVARGFEENDAQIRTDSPTCTKQSLRTLLCILASNNWSLHTLDVRSAYLQGSPISRELFLIPPKIAQTDKLWKLQKCPYGLVDAGRQWYIKIQQHLKELGGKPLSLDPGVFIWKDGGSLVGMVAFHVDDFIFGGTQCFHTNTIAGLKEKVQIGTEESTKMKFLGLHIHEDEEYIHLHNNPYTCSLEETNICSEDRRNQSRTLNQLEKSKLRHSSGQINWIATQSRPDIAFDNCAVGTSIANATVRHLIECNKAIRKAKARSVTLSFPKRFQADSLQIVCFCDASFANLEGRGSQGGHIIFVTDRCGNYCLIGWQSNKIKRVVSSTLSAECLAAVEATETCIHLRLSLSEILNKTTKDIQISVLTDNRSLTDAAHSTTTVSNKRLQIELAVLRNMIQSGELNEFRWVPGESQVANALTKAGASSDFLLDILGCKMKFIHSTATFVKA